MPGSPTDHYRARLAGLSRAGVPADGLRYAETRRNLRAAVLTQRVAKATAELAAMLTAGDPS